MAFKRSAVCFCLWIFAEQLQPQNLRLSRRLINPWESIFRFLSRRNSKWFATRIPFPVRPLMGFFYRGRFCLVCFPSGRRLILPPASRWFPQPKKGGRISLPPSGLFVIFFQSCLSFLYGFALFGQVGIHEFVFDLGVAVHNTLLDLLVAFYHTLLDLLITAGHSLRDF